MMQEIIFIGSGMDGSGGGDGGLVGANIVYRAAWLKRQDSISVILTDCPERLKN